MTRPNTTFACLCALLSLCLLAACSGRDLAPTPGDAIPEVASSGQRLLETYTHDGSWWVSPTLEAPLGATQIGTMLTTVNPDTTVAMQARGFSKAGDPTEWVTFQNTWSEHQRSVTLAVLGDVTHTVQIRIADRDVHNIDVLTWSAVVPETPPEPNSKPDIQTRTQGLDNAFVEAGVRPRSDWGARATNCTGQDPSKYRVAVHHTVTATSVGGDYPAQLRQIQNYHMNTRGWCDVGYHFLVTANGETWEARPVQYLGAHVGSNNTGNVGVSFVGCFHPTSDCASLQPNTPPQEMINSGGTTIGAIVNRYDIAINTTSVKGHRDHQGASTACPGDNLHARLPELREIAGGAGSVDPKGVVQGVVWDASITEGPADDGNVRIDSARVTCSCGQEMAVGSGNAYWSFQLPPGTHTLTASAPGYQPASREVTVTANAESWASIGLQPEVAQPATTPVSVFVYNASIGIEASIGRATIEGRDLNGIQTDNTGNVSFTVPTAPGSLDLTIQAEGFQAQTFSLNVQPDQPARLEAGLTPNPAPQPDAGTDAPEGDTSEEDTSEEDTSTEDAPSPDASPTPDTGGEADADEPDTTGNDTAQPDTSGSEDGEEPTSQQVASNDFCSVTTPTHLPSHSPITLCAFLLGAFGLFLRRRG